MLSYCHFLPKNIKLRAVTDLKLYSLKLMLDVESCDPSITLSRWIEACQHGDQSCLSGSIWSKKTKHLSFLDSQGEILGGNFLSSTASPRVNFSDIFNN